MHIWIANLKVEYTWTALKIFAVVFYYWLRWFLCVRQRKRRRKPPLNSTCTHTHTHTHTHTLAHTHTHTCAPAHTCSNHVTNITMYLQHQRHQILSLLSLTCITCIYTHMLTYIIQRTILCKSRSSETNDSNWPNGYLRRHVYMIPLLSSWKYILKQFW